MATDSLPQSRHRHREPPKVWVLAWKVHLALAGALTLLALAPPCVARACALGILAAASPALLLRNKWGASEYIGVSAALAMVFWPAAAMLAFATHTVPLVAWLPAAFAGVSCALEWRSGRAVRFASGPADRAAAAFALALAIPIAAVSLSNGPFVTPQGEPAYEARSWFSSDSFYLFSLAQASQERRAYPPENPFYPGAANCYPSLMHCGLGVIASTGTGLCARDCWRFFPGFALLCAPLWIIALLRRAGRTNAARSAPLAAAAAACLFLARPDFFIAIQSQAVALPVLLLVLWSLGPPGGAPSIRRIGPAFAFAVVLVLSHSITSAAALALIVMEALRYATHYRERRAGIAAVAALLALAALYIAVNRSQIATPRMGGPAPRALNDLWRYHAAWIAPLVVLAATLAWMGRRTRWHAAAAAATTIAGVCYVALALRLGDPVESWFALFNARRFWFLAMLVAMPALFCIPARAAWASVAVIAGFLLVAPDDSRRDTIGLVTAEPRIAHQDVMNALEAVRRRTPPDARIQSNLGAWVPAFTGRSTLVADPINLWAHGAVTSSQFDRRKRSSMALFDSQDPAMQRASLAHEGCNFVLAYGPAAQRIPLCETDTATSTPACVRVLFTNSVVSFGEIIPSR
jgi:hypothetical protein